MKDTKFSQYFGTQFLLVRHLCMQGSTKCPRRDGSYHDNESAPKENESLLQFGSIRLMVISPIEEVEPILELVHGMSEDPKPFQFLSQCSSVEIVQMLQFVLCEVSFIALLVPRACTSVLAP